MGTRRYTAENATRFLLVDAPSPSETVEFIVGGGGLEGASELFGSSDPTLVRPAGGGSFCLTGPVEFSDVYPNK